MSTWFQNIISGRTSRRSPMSLMTSGTIKLIVAAPLKSVLKRRQLNKRVWSNRYNELLTRTNNTDVVDNLRATTGFVNWEEECVRTVTSEQVEAWAAWRKRSVESIWSLWTGGFTGSSMDFLLPRFGR